MAEVTVDAACFGIFLPAVAPKSAAGWGSARRAQRFEDLFLGNGKRFLGDEELIALPRKELLARNVACVAEAEQSFRSQARGVSPAVFMPDQQVFFDGQETVLESAWKNRG